MPLRCVCGKVEREKGKREKRERERRVFEFLLKKKVNFFFRFLNLSITATSLQNYRSKALDVIHLVMTSKKKTTTKKVTHLDSEERVLFVLDRRDVLDSLAVDGRVQDIKLLCQLRELGVLGEEVRRGHAELVVLDGDVEGGVGELGSEQRAFLEEARPDPGGPAGLGEGQRGRHGLEMGFVFVFIVKKA